MSKFTITNKDGEQFVGEMIGEPIIEYAPVTWDRGVSAYELVTEIAMQWGKGVDIWDYLSIQRDSRNHKIYYSLMAGADLSWRSRWYWIKSQLFEMKQEFDMWLFNMKRDFPL